MFLMAEKLFVKLCGTWYYGVDALYLDRLIGGFYT